MSLVPDPGRTPEVRASDDDRNIVIDQLRRHCADGRLDLDEFSQRLEVVYAARTIGELELVTRDLPAVPATPPPAGTRRPRTSVVLGILSSGRRTGRWRPARRTNAFAFWGGCLLDLRSAELDEPVIDVQAVAVMGGVKVIVPEGVDVDLSGLAIMGGKKLRVSDVPRRAGTPLVRVRAFAFWGSVDVFSLPPRGARRRHHRHRDRLPDPSAHGAGLPAAPPVDLPGLTDSDVPVTILFSDIVDFTGCIERLGDRRARELLDVHNRIVRHHVAVTGGREVKTMGDSFMLSFASPRRALECAEAIQRDLLDHSRRRPDEPLTVRIGIHTGEALREADDFFGRTVVVAARIADHAHPGEVLVSSLVKELAEDTGSFSFGPGRQAELQGLSRSYVVHPLEPAA